MKVALVTGAGSGIGRAVAVALGNCGYRLVLAGRRREPLEETAELSGAPETLVLEGDVTLPATADSLVAGAAEGLGGLDVLVNNAGRGEVIPIASMSARAWDDMLAVNASSAAYCTMAAWPQLTRQPGGVIVNIASMAVYDPFEGFMAYGAAKAAMAHLTVSCAKEGAPAGLKAYCICPGAVETPLLRSAFDLNAIPQEQTLRPEEVAAIVLACVRGERTADNGRTIPLLPRTAQGWWEEWGKSHPTGWFGMGNAAL